MGRMLGVFDNDEELDRPDLNKCPDCGCFFAQDECPLCGKICPEEMRAGNRKAVKKKKHHSSGTGRVTFVDWYHSWWFIVLMMFIFPLAGIILLITSPHSRNKKIVFVCIAVVYIIVSTVGIGTIFNGIVGIFERPVDTSLSREEYIAACDEVSAEEFFRSPDKYKGKFVKMSLTVMVEAYHNSSDRYYLCLSADGVTVVLRDCLIDGDFRLKKGDKITVWGQGGGEKTVYDEEYREIDGSCLNMAYVEIEK